MLKTSKLTPNKNTGNRLKGIISINSKISTPVGLKIKNTARNAYNKLKSAVKSPNIQGVGVALALAGSIAALKHAARNNKKGGRHDLRK